MGTHKWVDLSSLRAAKLKILHINTSIGRGGAAIFMKNLADNLAKNFKVKNYYMVYRVESSTEEENPETLFSLSDKTRYLFGQKKIKRILNEKGYLYLYLPFDARFLLKRAKEIKPDLIHLHNLHGGYFQMNLTPKLAKIAPIVWTFHDMFPITGHCACSLECEKWKTGCGNCPNLDVYPSIRRDTTGFLWRYKSKIYNSVDFTIVTPSLWLKNCVEESFLKNREIRLIYNGIDLDKFQKTERSRAREILNLPQDKKIILFTADGGIKNPLKGGRFVLEIYKKLKANGGYLFLNVGGEKEKKSDNWLNYGYTEKAEEAALLYSAADIYLFPTLAETFSLTVAESMACGLPVVSFETGGVPEVMENGKSGLIAKYKDLEDLTQKSETLLNDDDLRKKMSDFAIERSKKFDLNGCAENYFKLYEEILER